MLVILLSRYTQRVPMQTGTRVVETALKQIKPEELNRCSEAWTQVHMNTMLSAVINQKADDQKKEGDALSLDYVQGTMKLQKATVMPPLSTATVTACSQVMGHSKRLHVMTEAKVALLGGKVIDRRGKAVLKAGSSMVMVFLRNETAYEVRIPTKSPGRSQFVMWCLQ